MISIQNLYLDIFTNLLNAMINQETRPIEISQIRISLLLLLPSPPPPRKNERKERESRRIGVGAR